MEHHAPVNMFVKLAKWFADFAAMPGRIARLAELKEADADGRLRCTSCGTGRVGEFVKIRTDFGSTTKGVCNACKAKWVVSGSGDRLVFLDS